MPQLLDLFAGAGGCSVGYNRAGFTVTGVDHEPHADYPFELIVDDALAVLADAHYLDRFDVIAASPPCPRYSSITRDRDRHPDLIGPVRDALREWGGIYVIENVEGAVRVLDNPVRLCGSAFGLGVRRHRWFESNVWLTPTECFHARQGIPLGVYGGHADELDHRRVSDGTSRGIRAHTLEEGSEAMGIDWMTEWRDLVDAIPPAYTHYLGTQLLDALDLSAGEPGSPSTIGEKACLSRGSASTSGSAHTTSSSP